MSREFILPGGYVSDGGGRDFALPGGFVSGQPLPPLAGGVVTIHTPNPALNSDDINNNTNFRVFVKLAGASNGQIRVRFRSRSSGILGLVGAAIGKWDGQPLSSTGGDMTTPPFRLKFGGANTVNIPGNSTATSDFVTHTGLALAANDWLIVTFADLNDGNQRYSSGHTDATTMYKPSTADLTQEQFLVSSAPWNMVAAIQPGSAGGYNFSVDLVETNDPSGGGGGKPLKVWNGTAWVTKPVKVWSGSAWVTKPVKVWNGSTWV